MSYATQADVETLFGSNNVRRWADLNDSDVDAEITERIVAALAQANATIDDTLRDGRYALPFTGTIPLSIVNIAAKLTGVWLYESRGIQDFNPDTGQPNHRLSWHKKDAEQQLTKLLNGHLRLDLNTDTHLPEIVKDVT